MARRHWAPTRAHDSQRTATNERARPEASVCGSTRRRKAGPAIFATRPALALTCMRKVNGTRLAARDTLVTAALLGRARVACRLSVLRPSCSSVLPRAAPPPLVQLPPPSGRTLPPVRIHTTTLPAPLVGAICELPEFSDASALFSAVANPPPSEHETCTVCTPSSRLLHDIPFLSCCALPSTHAAVSWYWELAGAAGCAQART